MKQCARLGKIPHSMGIDPGRDYVLLDGREDVSEMRQLPRRQDTGMDEKVYAHITRKNSTTEQESKNRSLTRSISGAVGAASKMAGAGGLLLMMPIIFIFF